MYWTQRRVGPRSGFTLIEILVVIAIIAILVSLTAAAVMNVYQSGLRAQARSEIDDLEKALKKTMNEFGLTSIPSSIILRRDPTTYVTANPAELRSQQILMQMFGKPLFTPGKNIAWNGQAAPATTAYVLTGPETLVFFAGGIPTVQNGVNACTGFGRNDDPSQPPPSGQQYRGKNFNFRPERLVPTNNQNAKGFLEYLDTFNTGATFAFFSSYGLDNTGYATIAIADVGSARTDPRGNPIPALAAPYLRNPAPSPGVYYNNKTFQIISAGPNGQFGAGSLANPAIGPLPAGSEDNMTNFSPGPLTAVNN
jgi:prepilin-type N-terminal cleavage/methylation domain-containing protein